MICAIFHHVPRYLTEKSRSITFPMTQNTSLSWCSCKDGDEAVIYVYQCACNIVHVYFTFILFTVITISHEIYHMTMIYPTHTNCDLHNNYASELGKLTDGISRAIDSE